MAFPQTPLASRVELYLGGAWTDVTDYAYVREGITITRGRSDEGSGIGPSSCRVVLNNRDGRFSPRNPVGPYYGQLTRNTPIRVSTLLGSPRLIGASGWIQTPDSVPLSVTGDLDVRVDYRQANWTANVVIGDKWGTAGQRSWRLYVGSTGNINFDWTADGTTILFSYSTLPVPVTSGRQALRAVIDVNNGAGGRTVTFYTAPTIAGPWTQLGDPVVQAGVTSIFDGTTYAAFYVIGGWELYAAEIRNGIGGPLVASPTLASQTEGALSFTDAQGAVWTKTITPQITARSYRFYGEVASWPQSWDVAGVDVRTSVEAAGVFRRLGQGADPLKSSLQRFVARSTTPSVAYWPMEDTTGSTSIASGLSGGSPMTIVGTPELASNETFTSSNPLPVLAGAGFFGNIAFGAPTGTVYLQMLVAAPLTGEPAVNRVLLRLFTTGTAVRWDVVHVTGTEVIWLNAFDAAGGLILNTATAFSPNGKPLNLKLQLVQNGGNIDWGLFLDGYFDPTPGLGPTSGTIASQTVGAAWHVQVNPAQTLVATAVGHLAVYNAIPNQFQALQSLRGYLGERAGRRIERLCSEEGIPFTAYGYLDETPAMGPQRPDTLLNLFAEAEAVDLGQIFESREHLGVAYRTRDSMQFQSPTLALAYGNLTDLQPVEDDQGTRNDITVTRIGGSSVHVTLDSGPLSTQAPPNGVGRYSDGVELSLASDTQLPDQAQMRLTLGTVDEARYPEILVRLETAAFAASAALTDAALRVDHGDLITITGLPSWLPPDQVRQHTIGQSETLGVYEYAIGYVCTPIIPTGAATMYDVLLGRYSGNGSTLAAAVTSSATALPTSTPTGMPLWTTNAADYPLDLVLGGELVTASGIAGFVGDTFTRTVGAGGWGTADVGGAWTPDSGAADFSVNGTRGVISTAAGAGRTTRLLSRSAVNVDAYATFDVHQIPTGATMEMSLGARRTGNDRYNVWVEFTTAGQFVAYLGRNVGGVGTTLGTVTSATAYTAGTGVRVRLRITGSTVQAKAWLANANEPIAWGVTATDTTITAEGAIYLAHFRYGGNTSADPRVYFDNLSVPEPQVFTVTRSINGVVKAHPAGTAIEVADPFYYSF